MVGDQVELGCERFRLRFAADGKPLSFKLLPEGTELLRTENPNNGFVVKNRSNEQLPMTRLKLIDNGERLVASTGDGGQEVTFRLKPGRGHIGFQVEKLVRFSPVPDLTLAFQMNVASSVQVIPHNYMVRTNRIPGDRQLLEANWPSLWNVHRGDDPGGFSLYYGGNQEELDDELLRVWATQPIAHPKIEGDWTYERAKDWVGKWLAKFGNHQGTIVLEADNLADLYKGLDYAEASGISEVYLMP
jgi:hypothetical protein